MFGKRWFLTCFLALSTVPESAMRADMSDGCPALYSKSCAGVQRAKKRTGESALSTCRNAKTKPTFVRTSVCLQPRFHIELCYLDNMYFTVLLVINIRTKRKNTEALLHIFGIQEKIK